MSHLDLGETINLQMTMEVLNRHNYQNKKTMTVHRSVICFFDNNVTRDFLSFFRSKEIERSVEGRVNRHDV